MRKSCAFLPLQKSATTPFEVGGIASAFYRDLDGEAITPEAVASAIPAFMAQRGSDGVAGGPIRLHHDFWSNFLKRAIASLNLPAAQQMDLVAAIALPLGRVTEMWVDENGDTHWRGRLSEANPISRILWQMLKEGLISLGVSLGGKIFATERNGRDRLGRPCNLITKIRIDELSVTDNPALRLTEGEGTGAYISALAKSARSALKMDDPVELFLRKAITPGLANPIAEQPPTKKPAGKRGVNLNGADTKTGLGGKPPAPQAPKGSGNEPTTDVWGMTVAEMVRSLGKACDSMKAGAAKMQSPDATDRDRALVKCEMMGEMAKISGEAAYGLLGLTDTPPDVLVNLVRLLHEINQFAQTVPHMDDYQARGTIAAMGDSLQKSLEEFEEKMPSELMGKIFRPEGSPPPGELDIQFPKQYVIYG